MECLASGSWRRSTSGIGGTFFVLTLIYNIYTVFKFGHKIQWGQSDNDIRKNACSLSRNMKL